jgi:hypothetical protein
MPLKLKLKVVPRVLQHLRSHPRRIRGTLATPFSARQRSVTKKQRSMRVLGRVLKLGLPIFSVT